MSNRKCESYEAVFKYIEEHIFKLEPAGLMSDWEAGMRNALQICYPTAKLRGCWYHYCAAIRKKCLKLGLHSVLKSDASARLIKHQIMSLPLLPSEHFLEGYQHIKETAVEAKLLTKFKPLFQYFENYWILQVLRKS